MIWAIGAVVLIVIAVLALKKKRLMTPAQFAEAVRQRIAEAHSEIDIKEATGLQFILTKEDKDITVFWDNAYAVYRQNPGYCTQIIDDFLKGMTNRPEPPKTLEEAKSKLLPSLRSRQYVADARKLPGGMETVEKLVVLDHSEELCILIAIDSELTISFAQKEQLEGWGVSPQQALEIAVKNLGKLTGPLWPDATEVARKHGFFAFNTMDGYDASRLLLPDFCQRACQALGCDRIAVGVPNRDYIAAFPVDSPVLAKHAEKMKQDFAQYDHAISPNLIYLPE